MTASTEPRGGLDLGWSSGEDGWGDAMNANLLRLSRLGFHPSVLSATTTAPPGSPISGAGYIIPSGATGAWAGKTGQVAVWDGVVWAYAAPRNGWTMHVDGAGLTTYDGGAWSQANVATAAGVGAEPYAGVPAQTSFWRSTAAGVRAWVQLVASDITDLATTLAAYLTKSNPEFTGTLTGPTATLSGSAQEVLRLRRSGATVGLVYGLDFQGQTDDLTWVNYARLQARLASTANGAQTGNLRMLVYDAGSSKIALDATPSLINLGAGIGLSLNSTPVIDSSRNITGTTLKGGNLTGPGNRPLVSGADGTIDDQDAAAFRTTIGAGTSSLAIGSDSTTAHRGDHGTTAYSHSQATGNPHGTTAADVGALAKITLTGTIDSQAINGGAPGLYDLHGSVYTNFPGAWSASAGGTLLQTVAKNGRILQELHSEINGKMIQAQTGPTTWSGWTRIWDNGILPVSTTGLAVVTASSQAAARAAIGLAQAEILIHSDFGRSATTDVWQSAFTNNAASGLQLAANSTSNGTEIIIEQVVNIPADGGGAAYQVYIGPQLTGEDSPTGSTYADVIDPSNPTEYGAGTLRIKIELIGSGSSITGYVTSAFECSGSNAPFVRTGAITVDGTIANSIDVRFNPDTQTNYIIRRNRVFRRSP